MQHAIVTRLTEAEYLRGEEDGVIRHEYVAGQIFAMAGGSKAHNIISGNIFANLRDHLRGSPCRTYIADMKVQIEHAEGASYYYPDVVVSCAPLDTAHDAPANYLIAPILIVEVLSPGTESTDRREKMLAYARLASLREYLLVDSQIRRVEIYRKNMHGGWEVDIPAPEELVQLESVAIKLNFAEIYEESGIEL